MRRLKILAAVAITALLLFGGAACGGDDKDADETETTGHEIVPDSQVTQGLAATQQLLADIESGKVADKTRALDAIEAGWASYEGTIKKNEVDLYLDFEDALAAFQKAVKAGNSADTTTAKTRFAAAAQTYLAKHP